MTAYEQLIRDFAYERRDFKRTPMTTAELAVIAEAYSDEVIAEPMGNYHEMVVNTLKQGCNYGELGAVALGIMKGAARSLIEKDIRSARAELDEEERIDARFEVSA